MFENILQCVSSVRVHFKATQNQILAFGWNRTSPSDCAATNFVIPMEWNVAGDHIVNWN